jgi:hypothetical protein
MLSSSVPPRSADAPVDSNDLFLPMISYGIGDHAWSVAAADLNGDGIADLVVGGGNGVGVLLGNGDGTFQPPVFLDSGGNFVKALVADANRDGKPDLLLVDECDRRDGLCRTASVGVLLSNGDGTFQPVVTYDAGVSDARSIAVADLNGDHKLDLVVGSCTLEWHQCTPAEADQSQLSVLLGNGDGTFQPAVTYGTGGYLAWSVVVADLDGDGRPDLVVGNSCSHSQTCLLQPEGVVGVLLGNGDGTFQPAVTYDPGGEGTGTLATADVNGDNKIDLLVGTSDPHASGVLAVMLGNGDGTLQPALHYPAGGIGVSAIAVADVDGDGQLDVAALAGVFLGNGDGTFQPEFISDGDFFGSCSVSVSDLNHDGRLDLVVGNCYYTSFGVLLNNTGPHTPTTTTVVSSANPTLVLRTVTYTASVTTVSGRPASRTITFMDGTSAIATVMLTGGQASFTTSKHKKIGTHAITAVYSGDTENSGSTSAILTQYIQGPTITTLATSGSPSHVGQPVTFTASITSKYGKIPNGELVKFYDGNKLLGTVPISTSTAVFTTSSLSVKTHTIKAVYVGEPLFKTSTGRVTQIVEP